MTTTDQILLGLGLVIVLALGCQLVASRAHLPAIVLLLPAGFIAGAATHDVHPAFLFGNTFQPIVSLGVGLILFEAGLSLRFDELQGGARRVVLRLIPIGVVLTVVGVTLAAYLILGLGWGSSLMLGAILVVSGPTVVLPLLEFVRPSERVRSVLKWEGVLIDPIGALLGVLVFTALQAHAAGGGGRAFQPGELVLSIVVGLAIGALGAGALWLMLGNLQRSVPQQSIAATLLTVVAAIVASDLIREDAGFVAATVMGDGAGQPAAPRRLPRARVPGQRRATADRHPVRTDLGVGHAGVGQAADPGEPGGDRGDGAGDSSAGDGAGNPRFDAQPARANVHRVAGAARNRRRGDGILIRSRAGPSRASAERTRSCRSPSWRSSGRWRSTASPSFPSPGDLASPGPPRSLCSSSAGTTGPDRSRLR